MLKIFTISIFVLIIGVAAVSGQKPADQSADETAIRANVEQLARGWNAKSGAEFAKPFAGDADYVVINGMQLKSRAVIDKAHQQIFDTIYKNTTISLAVQTVRFLRPDVAVVHVSGVMKLTEGETVRTTNARMTLVMTKTGGQWQIDAFQNTPIRDASAERKD